MSDNNILDNLDADDKLEYQKRPFDLTYVGKNSGNTILHIMAFDKANFKDNKETVISILMNKSIDVNKLNKRKRTCVAEAMKFDNYEFVKLLIENSNINLELLDDKGTSVFDFACYANRPEIAMMIIDRVKSVDTEFLHRIKDKGKREEINSKIYLKNKKPKFPLSTYIPEFKIFKHSDFTYGDFKGKGTYGVVNNVIEKSTGKHLTVKKFNIDDSERVLPDQVIRDIVFLRKLNEYGTSVKIYGVLINGDDVYMVMEKLVDQISKVKNNILSLTPKLREIEILELIHDILVCIDQNSKLGIIHCDTKGDNIMTDDNGSIRYIDYGFSYYIGISGFHDIINKTIHSGTYLSKDGTDSDETVCDYIDYTTKEKLFTIVKGYTGLNIDISSVGFMIISSLVDSDDELIGVYDDKIYNKITQISHSNNFIVEEDKKIKDKILAMFGQKVTNLLMRMMIIDPKERPNAKELLNDPIFNKTKLIVPENIDMIEFKYPKEKILAGLCEKYNNESKRQYIRSGFVYYDEIYDSWKNETIALTKLSESAIPILKFFIKYFEANNISIDSFYNALYYLNEIKSEITYGKFLYYAMAYSQIYEDLTSSNEPIIQYMTKKDNLTTGQAVKLIHSMFDKCKNDPNFYRIRPTMVFVGYYKFILQCVLNDSKELSDIMMNFQNKLFSFIVNYKGETSTIKISELVKIVYDNLNTGIDISI